MGNAFFRYMSIGLAILLLSSCGQSDIPFEYKYKSRDIVVITYQGKTYELIKSEEISGLPFTYEFEEDGDLDITLNGQLYELESPYDIDVKVKKKSTKKKSIKKKVTKKSKRK